MDIEKGIKGIKGKLPLTLTRRIEMVSLSL